MLKNSILQHLKRTGENEWTLDDRANHLLYVTKRQVELYRSLSRKHYSREALILEEAAQRVIAGFPDSLNIVGLAAGPSERESILIKAALTAGKRPRYFAVDKSLQMLLASGIHVPIRAEAYFVNGDLFSTGLNKIRETTNVHNLITFLGYTAFNFGKTTGLKYLARNVASGDSALVTLGTLPGDISQVLEDYKTPEIISWGEEALLNSGFRREQMMPRIVFDKAQSRIKFGYEVVSPLQGSEVKAGDWIVLVTSVKLPLEGRGGYLPLISKYLHIDDVFTEPTGMTAVIQASAKQS